MDSIPGAKSPTDDDAQPSYFSHEWPDSDVEILQEAFLDGKPQPMKGAIFWAACLKQMFEARKPNRVRFRVKAQDPKRTEANSFHHKCPWDLGKLSDCPRS